MYDYDWLSNGIGKKVLHNARNISHGRNSNIISLDLQYRNEPGVRGFKINIIITNNFSINI